MHIVHQDVVALLERDRLASKNTDKYLTACALREFFATDHLRGVEQEVMLADQSLGLQHTGQSAPELA